MTTPKHPTPFAGGSLPTYIRQRRVRPTVRIEEVYIGETDAIPLGEGLAIPSRIDASTVVADLPVHLEITIELEEGRPVCTELRCRQREGGPPITGTLLRDLKIATLVAQTTQHVALRLMWRNGRWEGVHALSEDPDREYEDALSALAAEYRSVVRRPKRGQRWSDDHFKEIARLYREKLKSGSRSPNRDLANALQFEASTVSKWVMEARRRGFLGPAERGKAGEGAARAPSQGRRQR